MAPYRRSSKEIRPEIARIIAKDVEKLAIEVRVIQQEVKSAGRELNTGWIGKAKTVFFSKFGQVPGKIGRFGDGLSHRARKLRVLTIVIEVEEWVEELFDRD